MQSFASDRSIHRRMRNRVFPRLALTTWTLILLLAFAGRRNRQERPAGAEDHEREELGVNPFTAPSSPKSFQQLDDLTPLPFELVKRGFPQVTHSSREQMGLVFGGLVADGFLIVECQKTNLVEDLGRALVRSGAKPRRRR